MCLDINLVKDLRDLSAFIDQKRRALYAHILFAVHAFFDPNAVFLHNDFIGVGDERKRQIVFRDKLLMRLFAVGRNADHLNILFIKFVARIPERTCFLRSARRVIFRIEEQNQAFAIKI